MTIKTTFMRLFSILIIAMVMISSCSRKAHQPGDTFWNYQNFRANQQSFTSTDGNIKYVDKGEGPVILLLHGVPSSSWLYRKMIDGLVSGGYRVIAPDMLGFGSSESPDGYEVYSGSEHAKRILELMNYLKLDSWTHVMHDAGGLWTWEMIEQAPKKINNLIILNTIIYEEGFDPPIRMRTGLMAKTSMWAYRNGITTKMLLNKLFDMGLNEDNLTKDEVEGYRRPLREGKTKGMYYFFTQTCNALPDYHQTTKNLNVPTMVIWGEHDEMLRWLPQKDAVSKDLNIKSENVHLIDAKHFIQEEKPEEINELILNFLSNR